MSNDNLASPIDSDATPNTSTPPVIASASAEATNAVRLGMLTGDLRCHHCAFNLRGQNIVREPHYRMVMVRCPECGTPAPLSEYPRLSVWSRRLGTLFAMAYLAATMAVVMALAGISAGMADGATEIAVEPVAMRIATAYIADAKAAAQAVPPAPSPAVPASSAATSATIPPPPPTPPSPAPGSITITTPNGPMVINIPSVPQSMVQQANETPSPSTWIDAVWWTAARKGGWDSPGLELASQINERTLSITLYAAIFLIPLAGVLASLMTHLRRIRLLLIPVGVLAVASIITFIIMNNESSRNWQNATLAALSVTGPGPRFVQLAMMGLPLSVGVLIGRPVARLLVRWTVPPRHYVHFGFLWAADGRTMPKTAD